MGDRVLLARGGNGGFGNAQFKSSVNQAPRHANPGEPGEERWLWLRLKLIADVGLVGLPNAGKSTLLAAVSAAKPKIADYPFTTLNPGLGVVAVAGDNFVMADIPGLIEGAHEGAGLGVRFLGHVERCAVLFHVVDASGADPVADYRTIRRELKAYGAALETKPELIALNKADLLSPEAMAETVATFRRRVRKTPLVMSGATGQGVREAMAKLLTEVDRQRRQQSAGQPGDAHPSEPEGWQP